jgi:hypothetical protein
VHLIDDFVLSTSFAKKLEFKVASCFRYMIPVCQNFIVVGGSTLLLSLADLRHPMDVTSHLKIKDYCESHESLAGGVCSLSSFVYGF